MGTKKSEPFLRLFFSFREKSWRNSEHRPEGLLFSIVVHDAYLWPALLVRVEIFPIVEFLSNSPFLTTVQHKADDRNSTLLPYSSD